MVAQLRGRSQVSTFMKTYTVQRTLGGMRSGTTVGPTLFPENQHFILITDNAL